MDKKDVKRTLKKYNKAMEKLTSKASHHKHLNGHFVKEMEKVIDFGQ